MSSPTVSLHLLHHNIAYLLTFHCSKISPEIVDTQGLEMLRTNDVCPPDATGFNN